jgi:diaminohydroxyphosphoribosylaminopyrimidine deaminase / 5-amino-6-(5-phosphoribosylamino)uracil reductase
MDEKVMNPSPSAASVAIGQRISPAEAMRLAIAEAGKGAGYVSPNPLVGCTIVDREHRLLAVGYHRRVGHDHAEVDALKQVADSESLKGAHVYVTLEPCAHQGRTPSCARTLSPLELGSVTYAVEDPNPLVAGKGARILSEAGVEAKPLAAREDFPIHERQELIESAEEVAEIFLHNFRHQEIFVAAKIASTLDGKIALASGESKWITGEKAREHVHEIRAGYDAVLIGRNTFVADDPSLNVRHPRFVGVCNKAIVLDPKGRTLESIGRSNLLKVRSPESVIVVMAEGEQAENPAGVRVLRVAVREDGTFLTADLLGVLKGEGLTSVLLEGGSGVYGSFFSAGKVRRLYNYIAPSLMGGKYGVAWSAGFGSGTMAEKIRLQRSQRLVLGEDLFWTARVTYPGAD